MYRILIVGAGYVGSALAAHFRFKCQRVWTVTRTDRRKAALAAIGAEPLLCDLMKPETLEPIPAAHFIVLCPAPEMRDEASYRGVYLDGIGNYLDRAKRHPKPHLVVYLSSTGVYGEARSGWVDEETKPEPDTEKGKILLEAEERVLGCGLPSVVFRLSGIYGPGRPSARALGLQYGTGTGGSGASRPRARALGLQYGTGTGGSGASRNWIQAVKNGRWRDSPDTYLNMIHLEDIVGAVQVLFNRAQAGCIYLGVDDEPVRRSEFLSWLSHQLGISVPEARARGEGPEAGGKRCRNARLKSLGYPFKFPTFREGYQALLRS